ncbi:hypothetical protein HD553DRAFT_335556 [Filobasidium floriforme]|uniref:uncharacterized protein n=1 Tax=Filobasidium floriforme TaxID=5210 RepID=UPI001E8E96C3|nr:uncharacterized protein HD553DRAFT_335556 [Filobasidium floriforme]KAH8084157.1 hypothetical protein HD553DRAFT_335556 [Filobasidium floriforme]
MPSMTGTSTGSPAPTATHVERSIDPTLFAGKVFHIAPGLFKEYEDKLKADIKLAGGSHTDSMWESNYVLHNPPSSHKKWHQDITNRKSRAGEPGSALLIPTIRPYHWFYTCIHARPARIFDTTEPEYCSRPILVQYEKHFDHNGRQLEITRPVKIYCTVNMHISPGESSCAEALENVVARLEANGGWRSPKRGTADVLILNKDFESGKKFAREAKPEQTVEHRHWLDNLIDKKASYVRGQPTAGIKKKTNVQVVAEQPEASGSGNGAADKVPKASGSAAGDKLWIQKPSVPFKGSGGRTEFTMEDEDKILRWLMYHHPEKTNWKSRSIYQELCDRSNKKHLEWADRHTPQSWHERVRKRFAAFSARSAQYAGKNVGLDRQLRTRAERAASAGTGGTGGERVEEGREEYVRSWMQDKDKEMGESDGGVDRSTAKGKDKGKDKAEGKGKSVMNEDQDQDDTDSFAVSEDATVNGKRKRTDTVIMEQPEGVGAGPTQKRTKQTSAAVDDDRGVPAPRPIVAPEVPYQTDVVTIEKTQVVNSDIAMDPELRPAEGLIGAVAQGGPSVPAEAEESFVTATGDEDHRADIVDQAVTYTTTVLNNNGHDNDQGKGKARAVSEAQDQEMAIETARIVIDAVATAFEENFEADGAMSASTQHSVAELDGMESFDLDDENVAVNWKEQFRKMPLVTKVGPEERVAGKTKDKRLSTLSERQVNEMVLDEEEESSIRSQAQVDPAVARAPTLEPATVSSEQTEQQVAPAPPTVEPSTVPPAVATPRLASTMTGNNPDPRRRATSTVSKSRRPVQTPERAAHIITQTTAKFGCDVRTVINAMQHVLKRDPQKSIPLKELWRVMAEDQKDGFKVFGAKS